ncbi:MAG: hypothetical protein E7262_08535 [Lachnospiraceae bacterium]|nr:hypothetical protein [Lachnospiraceae bacterium]
MRIKKMVDMQLPKNCKCLSTKEMMANESGWYVNFNTGELFITYRDIDATIRWVTSFVEDVSAALDAELIQSEVMRNRPPHMGPRSNVSGGVGFRINKEGFSFFTLDEEQMRLANSNIFIF